MHWFHLNLVYQIIEIFFLAIVNMNSGTLSRRKEDLTNSQLRDVLQEFTGWAIILKADLQSSQIVSTIRCKPEFIVGLELNTVPQSLSCWGVKIEIWQRK